MRPSWGPFHTGAFAAFVVAGLAAFGVSVLAARANSGEPAIPAGAHFTSWADNGTDGERVLQLVHGELPMAAAVAGVVKTDTDCNPDNSGINHCHNVIGLANGGEIEVVDNHAMMRHPCLSPGQKLTLARLAAGWVVAEDGQ